MSKIVTFYCYYLFRHGNNALTDENGKVVAEYKYDAWVNIIAETGTFAAKNPYRYAGYQYDLETGLYYLLARYYDAESGRFISRDAVQQINLYAYAANNPVMFIDPSGHVLIPIIYTVAEVLNYRHHILYHGIWLMHRQ